MKLLTTFLLTTFAFSLTYAQKVFTYSDSLYYFKVGIDSSFSGDSVNYDCYIKTISIYTKNSKKLVQTIIPPENAFGCSMPQNQIFLFDDINFDGFTDFMIMQFLPAAPNIPYYYWT